MLSSIHPRIRIGIVLVGAFVISGILMRYTTSETAFSAPSIQVKGIVSDFAQSISNSGASLLASIQSIKLPTFNVIPSQDEVSPSPAAEPTPDQWLTNPTDIPGLPSSTPTKLFPTAIIPTTPPGYPTNKPIVPTTKPYPTKIPKPTKVPKPTAVVYPPITSDTRPGTSLDEIMRDVEKRACVPYKFLMAIRTKEGGNWFKNMSASTTKMYNTFNWWNTTDIGTVCDGLGYWTQSGKIPPDSIGAGQTCENAIGDQEYDQKIMGIMQISEEEQTKALKYTVKTIPGKIDRRVLFDNILIFGIISKNRAGSFPQPSCTDWPQETVMEVARIHASGSTGSCEYYYSQNGASGNYCKEIWDLYKSFK